MLRRVLFALAVVCPLATWALAAPPEKEKLYTETLDVNVPHVSDDPSVKVDYDIVYVRADRAGDKEHKRFYTDFSHPVTMEPGADLMLLRPDGSEEVLVDGGDGSVTDPFVSFDGEWVYYSYLYDLRKHNQWTPPTAGADIFKIHLETRKIVRLTNQQFSPNTGAADWSSDYRSNEEGKSYYHYGVFNMGPCPLPDGRLAFTSNRDGFRPAKGYPRVALQLFVMDDRNDSIGENETPTNLEKIGHLNISGALHPVILKDGRIMYSTLESQGARNNILWGVWTIHPDGTNWAPLMSAFDPGGAPNGFHFQTQLSDESIVIEEYYNQNNSGFGAYIKLPASPPEGYAQFGPAYRNDPRNKPWRYGRFYNGKPRWYRMPFMPTGSVSLTPFSHGREGPADPSVYDDKESPHVGKFTHPSGAPNNHMLTVYSPGPVNHQYTHLPQLDGGIYLLKNGEVVDEPADLRLIKNDPNYNECWPRAVVPYKQIYGVAQPRKLPELPNDGSISPHLPEGTPFGLVGSSSFYKRESYPDGVVPEGKVTSEYAGGNDPWKGLDAFTSHGNGMPLNWSNQGGDVGLYDNADMHAVRILAMEPTTDRERGANSKRGFHSHAMERLRILGEIPLRKFAAGEQPTDPDGNPDTSFLAKLPADTAFTFQTLDKEGRVLNSAQTWHQLRPGERRVDCGGCHAHSQQPTPFEETAAAKQSYELWDLTKNTPLVASRKQDQSNKQWDRENEAGLKLLKEEVVDVEYHRDIRPILERSCVACHNSHDGKQPAGMLDLDADDQWEQGPQYTKLPGTYFRLAEDRQTKFGHKPFGYDSYGFPNASRYIRRFQSRRSLLVWKLYGERLDGFSNDDHPSQSKPGSVELTQAGQPVDGQKNRARWDLDYTGSQMPPPAAVKAGKVEPLSDEDRRTIVRWIDLGCPIDLTVAEVAETSDSYGWFLDDNRPIATVAYPKAGENGQLKQILIGLHDYNSGLDMESLELTVTASVNGKQPGENLAPLLEPASRGVWRLKLDKPLGPLEDGELVLSIRDKQGNTRRIERRFSVK